MSDYHQPVMLQECLDGLDIKPDGVDVDVTFGGGGHIQGEYLKELDGLDNWSLLIRMKMLFKMHKRLSDRTLPDYVGHSFFYIFVEANFQVL